jgi:beta-glucosidase/6-phospho-beta-glucosidase/beta-galactosidase
LKLKIVSGAWNLDGKSPSIWDTLVHTQPELITDRSNADVGADSYHFYKEDVKAIKNAGVKLRKKIDGKVMKNICR